MTDDTFYHTINLHRLKTPRLSTVYRCTERDWQDAESVLFIHGSLSSGRWWEPAMAAFEELMPSKYALYAPDLRSHGDADPLPIQGMESLSADLLSVMNEIGMKQAHIVGWSMGGGPAMLMALDHPERCLSLTLVSSVPPYGTAPEYIPANRAFIGEAIERGEYEVLTKILRASTLREGRFPLNGSPPANALFYYLAQTVMQVQNYPGDEANQEGSAAAMYLFNVADRCPTIKVPVLSLHGDADIFLSNAEFEKAREPWPSGKLQEVIFEGTSHCPPVEQPRRFAVTLDEFFSSI